MKREETVPKLLPKVTFNLFQYALFRHFSDILFKCDNFIVA